MIKKIGIYNPHIESMGGGEKVCLALAETLSKDDNNQVFLITHGKVDLDNLAIYFQLNLDKLEVMTIKTDNLFLKFIRRLPLPSSARNFFFDIVTLRAIKKKNFTVFINNCYQSNMPSPSKIGIYICMFPQKLENTDSSLSLVKKIYLACMHTLSRYTMHPHKKYAVLTYTHIFSNSEFTKSYVKKLWGKDSTLLYPICDDMRSLDQPKKEKIILHVGRFFENDGNNHHKRQDMMLSTFAELTQLHKDGWQLHFVGSVAEDVGALKYLLKLMKSAEGLPVYFHFNSSFPELKSLFNRATIYWHATGYGSNAHTKPERQEHFGITTVEAMSAGCIPIVIDTAGQKETVFHKKNGFLWKTPGELQNYTKKIASLSQSELRYLQSEAVKNATKFNKKAFNEQIEVIFGEIHE